MEEKKITDVRIGEYLTEDVSACVGKRRVFKVFEGLPF